jgi:hypothetical protein
VVNNLNTSTSAQNTTGGATGTGTPAADPSRSTGADNPAKAKVVIVIKPPTE